jgi:hypothetical protein
LIKFNIYRESVYIRIHRTWPFSLLPCLAGRRLPRKHRPHPDAKRERERGEMLSILLRCCLREKIGPLLTLRSKLRVETRERGR